MSEPTAAPPLLDVQGLHTEFRTDGRVVRAVDGVSFTIEKGKVLGLVGESGCGKSATSLSILRLLPREGQITKGRVVFDGVDLATLPEESMRRIRGRRIAMIFQDPMTSLNPYLKVEEQLAEVGVLHLGLTKKEAVERAVALLDRVGIPDARARARGYPHELSGGMRQRVMIAMALLCDPELLIADEPTTALDVTVQAEILDLVRGLVDERGLSVILITHDLGIVAGLADHVLVMYAGRAVETGPAKAVLNRPLHPYTLALLRSVPRLERRISGPLESIGGMPPQLGDEPFRECAFAPRCRFVHDACRAIEPELVSAGPDRLRRCVLAEQDLP